MTTMSDKGAGSVLNTMKLKDMIQKAQKAVMQRICDESGVSAIEFSLVFPILLVMLISVYDLGNGILVNQKTITASQVIADLVARNVAVDDDTIDDIIRAGELSIEPFDLENMGVDIISVEFDENDQPQVVWRETRNMDSAENAADQATGLGTEGDGAIIVVVTYNFQPTFSLFSIGEIQMQETSFSRGRRSAIVGHL